jgi:hypothetical protein
VSFIWGRVVMVVVLCAAVSLGLVACGDSGPSDKELAKAKIQGERQGRKERAEKEKERRLEKEIRELQKERRQEEKEKEDGADASPPSSSPPPAATPAPERSSCGGTLEVGPDTTCAFAESTRSSYESEIGSGPGTVLAYSEALDEVFSMSCTGSPHECSGAISAKVYFP